MKISIGKITAPVGIKGELRVLPFIDDAAGFASIKIVEIDETEYTLEKTRMQKNMLVIKLKEISDRNAAEGYRNKEIFADKANIKLPADTYLDEDIVGMEVFTFDGSSIPESLNCAKEESSESQFESAVSSVEKQVDTNAGALQFHGSNKVGKIVNVLHNSAQDLYEIEKSDGKTFLLPAVKEFILGVDIEAHCMRVKLIEGIDAL